MALTPEESGSVAAFFIIFALVIIGLVIFLVYSMKIIKHAEVMIVERFGKYHATLKPGLHLLIPFVDMPRVIHWRYLQVSGGNMQEVRRTTDRIDLREHVIDFGHQNVITKDTVQIEIDALVYYRVTDPKLAVFKIQNLPDAVELLTQTTLRNIMAKMTLDDTFSSRELINAELMDKTKPDAERWGVSIVRVEIVNIIPPRDIKVAMENQIQEERERRSTVLRADGDRESAIIQSRGRAARLVLLAEGQKQSRLNTARGEAEAKQIMARAEAKSIQLLADAIPDGSCRAADYLVALQYLNSLNNMTGMKSSTVTLYPTETIESIAEIASQVSIKNKE